MGAPPPPAEVEGPGSDPDDSEWHMAFEQLASEREQEGQGGNVWEFSLDDPEPGPTGTSDSPEPSGPTAQRKQEDLNPPHPPPGNGDWEDEL